MIAPEYLASFFPDFVSRQLRELGFVLLWLTVVSTYLLLKQLPQWVKGVRAGNWRIAGGMIETVDVKKFGQQALGELGYSYKVGEDRYSGYFVWQFADEQQAWDYVTSLKGQAVMVRYRENDPQVSALRSADQLQTNLGGPGPLRTLWEALLAQMRQL